MRPAAVALLVALTVAACAGWDAVDPRSITPSPGQPCGAVGVVCYGASGQVEGCCAENETCGGAAFPHTCPAGECCYLGLVGAPARHMAPAPDGGRP